MIRTLHITDAGAWPSRAFADPFVVCHGRDGPIDSIGWAVPAESRQDDALLQTQQITPTERLLCAVHDFDRFPLAPRWLIHARQRILE